MDSDGEGDRGGGGPRTARANVIDLTTDSSPEAPLRHLPHPFGRPSGRSSSIGEPSESRIASPRRRENGSGTTLPRPSSSSPRRLGTGTANDVIEVLSDSDDDGDEPLPMGGPSRATHPRPLHRTHGPEFRQSMATIDARLRQHRRDVDRLNQIDAMEAALNRAAVEPPPREGTRPRIGLGGAVFRAGEQQVRFTPGRAPQRLGGDGAPEPDAPPSPRPRRGNGGNIGGLADAMMPMVHRFAGPYGMLARLNGQVDHAHEMLAMMQDRILGLGRAPPRGDDVASILAKVALPVVPPAREGYTHSWDIDEVETEFQSKATIELDDSGKVVKTGPKRKPYLACCNCPEPLRISSAMRDDNDRIWALRCGHLVDERCLKTLVRAETPEPNEEEDEAPAPKRARKSRKNKKTPATPVFLPEHTWKCPTCKRQHTTQYIDGEWKQKPGAGAVQIFV